MFRVPCHPQRSITACLVAVACTLPVTGCTGNPAASGTANGSATATNGSAAVISAQPASYDPEFRTIDLGCDLAHTGRMQLDYAKNFTVDEFEGGVRLVCEANGERFLVVPAGASAPDGLDPDIAVIQQPLDSVYLVSTGMICLIDEIGALDAVTVSSVSAEDSPNADLTAALEDGCTDFGGKYSAPDFELIAERGCTLAIENTKINHAPEAKQKLQDLGVTVLTELSSSEPEVLGRLEWMKLMGVLFGREDEANARFDEIAQRVWAVADQAPTGKTVAFFYINDDGAAVTRRSTDYFAQMIQLAGGDPISFDPDAEAEGSSSIQAVIDLETFYAQAKDADVIIYNTTVDTSVKSIADLTAKNPLFADFRAVQDGEVYACDENMYQAMTDMDAILEDLRCALTGSGESAGFIWKLD